MKCNITTVKVLHPRPSFLAQQAQVAMSNLHITLNRPVIVNDDCKPAALSTHERDDDGPGTRNETSNNRSRPENTCLCFFPLALPSL